MEGKITLNFNAKYFNELTTSELYEILKARAMVFVIEQKILYLDMDDIDYRSLHVFYTNGKEVTSYLRAYEKEPGVIQLGRVLTVVHGTGLGSKLLKAGIYEVRERYNPKKIYIEAQSYATGYYELEGFKVTSDEFMEDGIPHVKMELEFPE